MSGHSMNARLSPSHRKWLAEQVSSGAFPSIDAALAWAIEGMIPLANDGLEWARPFLATSEASLARGEGIDGDVFLARLDRTIESLR
jgi:Arc/MetJ-type ribon-helix-helix transcriptional regulator